MALTEPTVVMYAAGRAMRMRTLTRYLALAVIALVMSTSVSCGGGKANLLENPGFEAGEAPWSSLEELSFERVTNQAHTGEASALLQIATEPEDTGNGRSLLVQDVTSEEFPEVLSGFYRVENWTKGAESQSVKVAVVVFAADNLMGDFPNHQVHYILAGVAPEPDSGGNIRNIHLGSEEPDQDQWVAFQGNVRTDFSDLWGAVPEGYELLRVIFEVGFDNKEEGTPVRGDVYFDDLHFGSPPD